MALDSRDKRASAISLVAATVLTFPLADGAIDTAADRYQCVRCYRGVAGGPAPPTVLDVYPDPFAATSEPADGRPAPLAATSTVTSGYPDPFAATSRLKGA